MAGRMLGLSLGDVARIDGFYAAFAGAMVYDGNPEPQRLADAARAELNDILHAELHRSRKARTRRSRRGWRTTPRRRSTTARSPPSCA